MSADNKPPEKPTVEIEKPPPWAIEMSRNVSLIKGDISALTTEFSVMRVDVRSLQQWRLDEERRRDEAGSIRPPSLNSERVRQVIDEHPSKMDLEEQAKLAHALIALDEERAKVARLESVAATKADIALLEKKIGVANEDQTKAIVSGVTDGVQKAVDGAIIGAANNPTVRKLAYAGAGLLFLALNYATVYVTTHASQPPQQVQP